MVFAFAATLAGLAGVAVYNAGCIIPETAPLVEVVHFIEGPQIVREVPRPEPAPEPEEEPEDVELLCETITSSVPPYPFPLPDWYLPLQKKMESKIDVRFSNISLVKALRHVSELTGLQIVIDPRVDTNYGVRLRLRECKVKNVLRLVLDGANLIYLLRQQVVFVTDHLPNTEYGSIIQSIENAQAELHKDRKYARFEKLLQSDEKHSFNWKGITTRGAVLEVCATWGLRVNHSSFHSIDLSISAPQGKWSGNCDAALERALANSGYSYAFKSEENRIEIMKPELAALNRYAQTAARNALKSLKKESLCFPVKEIKLYDFIKKLEKSETLFVIPDRRTWEKDITVRIEKKNPTIGDVLGCLEKQYNVVSWFTQSFEIDYVRCENALYLISEDGDESAICYSSGW